MTKATYICVGCLLKGTEADMQCNSDALHFTASLSILVRLFLVISI